MKKVIEVTIENNMLDKTEMIFKKGSVEINE